MTNFLRHWVTMACPRRWVVWFLPIAVLLCWTAMGWTLTPAPGTPIVNQATVQYGDANGNALPAATAATSIPLAGAPRLRLTKTADFNPVAPGATLTYTLRYENTGNASATGVQVVDTLPANVTFQSASPDAVYNPVNKTVTWTIGMLTSGSSGSLSVKVIISGGLAVGTSLMNAAIISSKENVSETAVLTTTIGTSANLVLTKTAAPQTATPNGIITYILSYQNIGNADARGVRMTDQIPTGAAYVAGTATAPVSLSGNTLIWDMGDISAGARGDFQFQVRISPLAVNGDQISNTASIISAGQTALSNTVVTMISAKPLLSISKTAPDQARAGQTITYAIQVENMGTLPLTGVIINDPLPASTTFVSADSGGVVAADGRQVNWTIGNLAVGQRQTVHMTVRVDVSLTQGRIIDNTATVLSAEAPQQSAMARTTINARTAGQVAFYNADWQMVVGYGHGDRIYIQTGDLDQNIDPAAVDHVSVVLNNLQTGDRETVLLTETGPDTGIFRGSIPSTLTVTSVNSGELTVAPNSRVQVTYTDILDAVPACTALALIDPMGVVFDSIAGKPVAGAIVTLRNWDRTANACNLTSLPTLPPGQINPTAPTAADGKFAFPLAPPEDYCFETTPPSGYTFPSTVPDAELPSGFNIGSGSRGDKFTLSAGDPALIRDIPLDPPAGPLTVAKSANKTQVAIGDIVGYSIKITNGGIAPMTAVILTDIMPHGVQYLPGSSRQNGAALADPRATGTRTFVWTIASIAPAAVTEITYRAVVGPDSLRGDGINTVSAAGRSLGRPVSSNTASVKIRITGGIFTEKGTIIGKVFLDRDGNRMQNQGARAVPGKPDEPGIPDVVLYLEDGTRVITDATGKYSILGIAPGTHVLRVDETSLPKGMVLVPLSNRFLGDGTSQFIDMTQGGLFQADFAVERPNSEPGKEEPGKPEKGSAAPASPQDPADAAPQSVKQVAPVVTTETVTKGAAPPAAAASEKDTALNLPSQEGTVQPPISTATPASDERKTTAADEKKYSDKSAEISAAKPQARTASQNWEEVIKTLPPELAFLSPTDGATNARKRGRVVIKAPSGTEPSLFVNGESVDKKQIGRKMEYPRGQVAIFEYIDIPLNAGEKNTLKAEVRDSFGILRGTKEITVTVAGGVKKIIIAADKTEIPADGVARVKVSVLLQDNMGAVVPESGFVTVSVTAGEIVEKDADRRAEGHQIALQDGEASFTIQAPRETGEATITVLVNDREEMAKIFFMPHLRDLFIVGMGEVKIGQGQTKGNFGYLKDQSWFDDGFYRNGRGAFFMKGKFFKDFLITAAYDSGKKKRDDLFRENDTALDTEDKYPIYGDESKTGYEALSADQLYIKIEKNRSYLMYGDYKTDLNNARLAAYNRSFTGLKYDLNTPRFKLRAFGSYTDQTQVIDALPGKGISGYYYLSKRPAVEGSERIVIEVRDRYRTDNVLSRESKSRGSDYEIDYDLGAILFKEPIPSHDGDYNPVYVVVSYESKSDGEKYYIYGGRGAFKLFEFLEIGATGVVEEKAVGRYQLYGADATLTLPRKTLIKAEYAWTRALFEESSIFNWQSANAWSVNAESQPLEKLTLKGYYRTLGTYFMNMSAADVSRGTTKYGFDATYVLRADTQIRGQFFDENDDLNNMRHRLASLGAQTKYKIFKFNAELSSESSTLNYIPQTSPTTRSPFDVSQDVPHDLTAVKVGVEADLWKNLSLLLNHKHNLSGDTYHITQAGLNYQLNKANRLYLREEYQQFQERAETRTLFGVESQVIKNTVAFNEYRLVSAADGSRNQAVIGLRNKFFLSEALTGNASAEYLRTVSGTPRQGEPDAVAVTLGMEYLAPKNTKVTSRFEHRRELIDSGRDSYLGELGVAHKLHQDFSLLLRERYFTEEGGIAGRHTTSRTMVGLAYRPLLSNRFNALSKMEYKLETNTGSSPVLEETAYIVSTEGIWQATTWLQLMGKYAGKLSIDGEFSAYTDLIATRFIYDLTDRWDIGAEYRMLTNHATDSRCHGGSVEVGYRIIKNLWASAGYSFDKFDADLAGDSYQGQGPYLKLRFKFDEKTLSGLWKAMPTGQESAKTDAHREK